MIKHRTIGAVALGLGLAMAVSMPAAAETAQGWYFGVSPGQSQYDINKGELDAVVLDAFAGQGLPVASGSSSLEDSDMAWSIFGGYRFSPYLAVEAGYSDLGTAEYRSSGTIDVLGVQVPANFDIDFETNGFTVAGIGTAPLGDMFDVHARLGMFFADSEVGLSSTVADVSVGDSLSASSQELFYGVGAAMDFGANWSLSLDWQQYKDVGEEDETDETDVNSITLALIFRLQ